jgi:hypothetical protein
MAETYSAPLEIQQGTTVEWTATPTDYPATDWTATFTLISRMGSLAVTGVADGADYDFTLTAAQTAAMQPGAYEYNIRVTDGTDTHEIESGRIYVLADVSAVQPIAVDGASPTRRRRDHYVALLGNESFVKTLEPGRIAEMEEVIRRLEWDLKREEDAEKAKRGINTTRKLYGRFI